MSISKKELDKIIEEEIKQTLEESGAQTAVDIASAIGNLPLRAAAALYDTSTLLDKILDRAKRDGNLDCNNEVKKAAKKRGWNMKNLTGPQQVAYVKLYEKCVRKQSKEYKEKRRKWLAARGRKIRNPYRDTVGTVRGGRVARALASHGHGAIKRLVKETLNEEINKTALAVLYAWLKEAGQDEVRDVIVGRLETWAEKVLNNPSVSGGQLGAIATKVVGGLLTVYMLWQMYQEMGEMLDDPDISAEWNSGIASFLSIAGPGLALHGAPVGPEYWGVESCDQLHGFALKNACARWEKKERKATSPRASERHGRRASVAAFEGRIFPPLRKGEGWRTWQELTRRERQNPKNYEKWIEWRKETGKQT